MEDRRLTAYQEVFCQMIARGKKNGEAAIAAGYSEKGASVQANNLLKKINIQERIQEIKSAYAQAKGIDNEWIAKAYIDIINEKDIKHADKLKAISELAKHLGFYEVHNKQKAGKFDDMTEAELDAEIQRLLNV